MCRVPAVIIAAVIGGAGLTACGASPASPTLAASSAPTSGTATTQVATPAATPTAVPSPTPVTSPTKTHSAAAEPSVTATHSTNSPHASPTSSATNTASGTHDFTVPAIPGEDVVTGWGSYTKIGTARVKVTMCAKQTGSAFSVGAIALVYNSSGASMNIGATILTGSGNSSCVMTTFILYTVHLKVHAFIGGSNGTIVKTGPVLTIY
jgi:hypothetical protein